jgi:hypothetical protein
MERGVKFMKHLKGGASYKSLGTSALEAEVKMMMMRIEAFIYAL